MQTPYLSRRDWMTGTLAWMALAGSRASAFQIPRFTSNPFGLGIASGDPWHNSVVLWTKLTAPDLRGDIEVEWEVATDDAMRTIVKRGKASASEMLGHSVHVEVEGLKAARWYFYRFRAGGVESPIGQTRTAPKPGSRVNRMTFAVASCQRYDDGLYTAYQHLCQEKDVELVVFLGDYIYEYGRREGTVREHTGGEAKTLADYRARYSLYKSDPLLQDAHRLFPWIVVWDDHETQDNWAGDSPRWASPDPNFRQRRAFAAQAYYEFMPLRRASIPRGPDIQVYRRFDYGDLMRLHMLDTRQFRSRQACMDGMKSCPEAADPNRTILGGAQTQWLYDGLAKSRAQWDVFGNQVIMTRIDTDPGPAEAYFMDDWNGYLASRKGLLDNLAMRKKTGTVVLTGDHHRHVIGDVYVGAPEGTPVTSEIVTTSISTGKDGDPESNFNKQLVAATASGMPVKYYEDHRGYAVCRLDREQCVADLRELQTVLTPGAALRPGARFHIDRRKPGAVRG